MGGNQILKSQQILQERKRKEAKEKERNKKLIFIYLFYIYNKIGFSYILIYYNFLKKSIIL